MVVCGFVAFAIVGDAAEQTSAQTIELPALDRSRIAFRVDEKPEVVVGPSKLPAGQFRILNQIVRLSDARMALATPWGFSSLNVLDASGKAIAVGKFNGRAGSLQTVCETAGDRLLVFHDRTHFTFFRPSGEVDMTGSRPDNATLLCPAVSPQVWIRLPVLNAGPRPSETPPNPAGQFSRQKHVIQRIDLADDARVLVSLGEFDGRDWYSVGPIQRIPGRTLVYSSAPRPLSRDLATAVDGERIHAGDGTTWEVRTWDGSGRLIRILRVAEPAEPVTPEIRAAFIRDYFTGNTDEFRARVTEPYGLNDPATYPARLPAYSDLRVDKVGRLWVRRYPRPLEMTQQWWVLSADAQYLGVVEMPAAFAVEQIGEDYIAGNFLVHRAPQLETDVISDRNQYEVRVYRFR